MLKPALAILFSICLLLSVACTPSPERRTFQFTGQFDSFTTLLVEDSSFQSAQEFERQLTHYHQVFTPYETFPDVQNLAVVNREAVTQEVVLDPDLNQVLALAWQGAKDSHGAFNPALGRAVLLWRQVRDELLQEKRDEILTPEDLAPLLPSTDLEAISYDASQGTLRFQNPDTLLDLGGVAKGWAVERLVQDLKTEGYDHCLLSIGGNVRALGSKANGEPWRVLIQDPFKGTEPGFPRLVVDLVDESLVTSGLYERYFDFKGQRYAHILDPEDLMPQDQYLSISILGKDSGVCDLLATALFNLSLEEGKALVNTYGVEALWIMPDGKIEMTAGFEQRLIPE